MSKIGLIIKREYSTRVKKKSFLLMTILGPILMVGFLVAAIWFGQEKEEDLKILIHDDTFVVSNYIHYDNNVKHKYELVTFDRTGEKTYDDAIQAFDENEDFDLLVYLPENILYAKNSVGKIIFKNAPSMAAQSYISSIINRAAEKSLLTKFDIDEETYTRIKSDIQFHTVDVETGEEKNLSMRAGVGFVFGFMIYLFIFMYGVQVMKGVIEEKSNRIVEVIVSSVKPFQLMMGKIIGIMFVGLTQFAIWVILSFSLFTVLSLTVFPDMLDPANQAASMNMDQVAVHLQPDASEITEAMEISNGFQDLIFNQIPWTLLISMFIFYFIGGYLLYGSLMAAIGAAVDSETDTQQFMLPVTAPLIFAYIIAIMAIENPNSPAVEWCSQIPFTSPIVMLVRVAMSDGGLGWEIALSMILLIGTFIGTTWIAGKIYRTGILMYGKKASYKEMFKWLRHK